MSSLNRFTYFFWSWLSLTFFKEVGMVTLVPYSSPHSSPHSSLYSLGTQQPTLRLSFEEEKRRPDPGYIKLLILFWRSQGYRTNKLWSLPEDTGSKKFHPSLELLPTSCINFCLSFSLLSSLPYNPTFLWWLMLVSREFSCLVYSWLSLYSTLCSSSIDNHYWHWTVPCDTYWRSARAGTEARWVRYLIWVQHLSRSQETQ